MRGWFDRADPPGVAVLGGAVSGGLECIDFDVQAESIYPQWRELVEAEAPGLARPALRRPHAAAGLPRPLPLHGNRDPRQHEAGRRSRPCRRPTHA